MSILHLSYPPSYFKYKIENGKRYIQCLIRRRYFILTPEEWVRQNFLNYLIEAKNYPNSLISVEKTIKVGALKKRYDIVVYNANFEPEIIVECKEAKIKISEQTLFQLLQYNSVLNTKIWILSNGLETYCAQSNNNEITWLDDVPPYSKLS